LTKFLNNLGLKTKLLLMMLALCVISIGLLFLIYNMAEKKLILSVKKYTEELSSAIQISVEQLTAGDMEGNEEALREHVSQFKKRGVREISILNNEDVEISKLAEVYINKGIIPKVKIEDALHIAYAVVFEMDVLLSWNFKHLANIKKEKDVLLTNMENGYNYPIRIITPMEVDYEDNDDF